jgi:hypothetical protein
LQGIRVLELVDHHVSEPLGVAPTQALVVAEQVARAELQVLEVEARPLALGLFVALPE